MRVSIPAARTVYRSVRAFAALLLVLTATPAHAQRTKWWQSADVQAQLHLTADQVRRIDHIFDSTLAERQALRVRLDQREAELRALLDDPATDDATAAAMIQQVEDARAKRNVARTMLVYRIRKVLTPEQQKWFDDHAKQAPPPGQ